MSVLGWVAKSMFTVPPGTGTGPTPSAEQSTVMASGADKDTVPVMASVP
jgi:hypothetical protein